MTYTLKKISVFQTIILLLIIFTPQVIMSQVGIPDPMTPPRLVNDFADIIPSSIEDSIERRLVAYDDSTSTQITVVTMPRIDNWSVDEFAFELGDKWGVGRKQKDNGIILLVALKERKTFIATGRGSEGAITDIHAKRIVDNILLPNFRNGKYGEGIDQATQVIMKLMNDEFVIDLYINNENENDDRFYAFVFVIIVFVVIIIIVFGSNNGGNDGGTIHRRGWGGPIIFNSGSGFGGSGSSFGGGSFGGFGGGSFGGGGAGGGW